MQAGACHNEEAQQQARRAGGEGGVALSTGSIGRCSSWRRMAGCALLGQLPEELLLRIFHFAASTVSVWVQ
jgi:hypothetical protein